MQFTNVAIESIAYALPEEVWTSADVEARLGALYQRLGLPEGRLELMTGIQERRFWPTEMPASEASALAGKAVLERSAFSAESMDLLIHSAVCRDRLEPATASYVHGLLGLPGQTQIFDLSNACLGFLNGLVVAGGLIESGQIDRALICSGENGRPLMEHTLRALLQPEQTRQSIKPYFANLTIGAGAVAAVVCRKDLASASSLQLRAAAVETDTSHNQLCQGDANGNCAGDVDRFGGAAGGRHRRGRESLGAVQVGFWLDRGNAGPNHHASGRSCAQPGSLRCTGAGSGKGFYDF